MNIPNFIIVDIGAGNSGKSTTLNNVWDLLPCYDPNEKIILNGVDRNGILGYVIPFSSKNLTVDRRYVIGLNANGDSVHEIFEGMDELVKHDCDIIICCARSMGSFDEALKLLLDKYNVETHKKEIPKIVRFSHFAKWPYEKDGIRTKRNRSELSCIKIGNANITRISAQSVINLIEQLIN